MSNGDLIRGAILAYLDGELEVWDSEPAYCLRQVRNVLSAALGLSEKEFWTLYATHIVDDHSRPIKSYWARDVMLSLREQGRRVAYTEAEPLVISELKPGDILASWRLARPEGHIMLIHSGGPNALALENTSTLRGTKVSGYNRLSRVDELPYAGSWEAFRL